MIGKKMEIRTAMPGRSILRGGAITLMLALVAGCANNVGNDPSFLNETYQARHPIVVSEKPTHLDLPAGRSRTHLSVGMKSAIHGFAVEYHKLGAKGLDILVPSGSANEDAAANIARQARQVLVGSGIPERRITLMPYRVANAQTNGNVRLTFSSIKAHVPSECGVWPTDIGQEPENRNYENFGCATQKNLAAIVADPNDLLGPRGPGLINAERTATVVGEFEANTIPSTPAPAVVPTAGLF